MNPQLLQLNTLLRPHWKKVLAAFLLLVSLTAIDMVFPTIIRLVIDVGIVSNQQNFLIISAGIILGLGILKAILSHNRIYVTHSISNIISYELRNKLYDHIQHLSFSYHDQTQSGQLISRCIEDVRSLQNFSGNGITELGRVGILLVGIVIILCLSNIRLAVIALLPMIPLIMLTTGFGRRIKNHFLAADQALGDLSSRLQENTAGAQVVRAFARETFEIQRFNQANRILYDKQVRVVQEFSKVMPSTQFFIAFATVLILWFGGQMVINHEITVGELVAFNSYMLLLANPAQQLAWLVNMAGEAAAGLQRTHEILNTKAEIQDPPDPIRLPVLRGRVEFENVSFAYTGENSRTLHDINLTVEPNQIVALVGPTGSGKTSLINLIPRFYDVASGMVRVDGYDVRQVELRSLRKQIGLVLQTSLLFSASIRENLAYGKPDASMDEIIQAAQSAQAHDFIMQLPEQYETVVGERGITLSGGQRQRISIGRALLMDPRILILDDSTSSVDTETERLIQKALDKLMEGRTTFVIAQRLSTVRRADLILVLDQGHIVERGTHNELLGRDGFYKNIYQMQLRSQEEVS